MQTDIRKDNDYEAVLSQIKNRHQQRNKDINRRRNIT